MQRTEDGQIIISCDFSGDDWDMIEPMIEGHRGSVISLASLSRSIDEAKPVDEPASCTMCLREIEAGQPAWRHPEKSANANPEAVICWDCIQQADKSFSRDPDTDWVRKIPPTDRWK